MSESKIFPLVQPYFPCLGLFKLFTVTGQSQRANVLDMGKNILPRWMQADKMLYCNILDGSFPVVLTQIHQLDKSQLMWKVNVSASKLSPSCCSVRDIMLERHVIITFH